MSTVVVSSATAPIVRAPRPARVALVLARIEGRRLVRRPIFLAGVMLSAALVVFLTWSRAPVLHRDDVLVAGSFFPLAVATYLAANLAGSRARRNHTEELFDAAPAAPISRTTAHLLSLAWPLAVSIILVGTEVGYLKAIGGVWSPSAQEIATGPMIVLIFGAFGVLVSRVAPAVVAGPVGLVGLGAVQLYLMQLEPTLHGMRRWGAFWITVDDVLPRELVYRPAGWHLAYLGGVAAFAIAATRLRHGAGFAFGRAGAVTVAVALLATGLWGQSRPQNHARELDEERVAAREPLVCETHDATRYCAYRAYAPWIARWRDVVTSVFAGVPARPGLVVQQSLSNPYEGKGGADRRDPPGLLGMNAHWGIRFKAGSAELAVASRAAAWAVGLPAGEFPSDVRWTKESIRDYIADIGGTLPPDHEALAPGNIRYSGPCQTVGQARAIVALWLAGRSSPDAANALRASRKWQPRGLQTYAQGEMGLVRGDGTEIPLALGLGSPTYTLDTWPFGTESQGIEWGIDEAYYAMQLLDRPAAEVRRAVMSQWAALTAADAKTEDAVSILRLKPLPTMEEQLRALRITPEQAIRQIYAGAEPAKIQASLAQGADALVSEGSGAPCP